MGVRLGSLALVCSLMCGLFGAWGCGDDDDAPGGDDESRVAEALARAMHFSGGELRDGAMELASEERVEVVLATDQVMRPGRAGIMALDVDNPVADDKPAQATLMQFGEVEQHVRVPTDESVDGAGDLNFEFQLDDDACEGLCAALIEVPITVALELEGGDISKHLKTQITLDCREDGSQAACEGSSSPGGRDGGAGDPGSGAGGRGGSVSVSPGATAAVEGLLDAVEEFESGVCSCLPGAQGDACSSASTRQRSCNEAVLLAFAEGNEELIECTQVYFEDQSSCTLAAACDADALEACSAASDEGDNWTAIEMQCGTVPIGIRTGIDACGMGGGTLACANGEPVAVDEWCDGAENCADGSDELGCTPTDPGGRPTQFPCSNGDVLELDALCDGVDDCPDGYDEKVCIMCPDGSGQFSAFNQCDGEQDCADGADEAGCTFACTSGEMVMIQALCDGSDDCADGSDESFCTGQSFTCPDGEQIPAANVCDGTEDCSDGGDESVNVCG